MSRDPTHLEPDCILVESQGGIGNQLFIYAYARAIETQSGLPVAIDIWRHKLSGARSFQIAPIVEGNLAVIDSGKRHLEVLPKLQKRLRRWDQSRRPRQNQTTSIVQERSFRFDPKLLEVRPGTRITGYFQSWRYFESISDRLRAELSIRRNILLREHGYGIPASDIALHVRLGDYLHFRHRRTHNLLTPSYYREALALQLNSSSNNAVTVFSDEPDVAIGLLEAVGVGARFEPCQTSESDLHELLMLSTHHRIICANSTFSWWAAWLGDLSGDSVTVPRRWINRSDFSTTDLFPETWTVLP